MNYKKRGNKMKFNSYRQIKKSGHTLFYVNGICVGVNSFKETPTMIDSVCVAANKNILFLK